MGDIATECELSLSTAAPELIEQYWEQDILNQMAMKDLLCVVLWIQQDEEGAGPDDATESFINRFDHGNVTVFRISSLCISDRLKSFDSRLSGAKFDGRIRIVVSTKDPVSTVKSVITHGFLRSVPILVHMTGVDTPEDTIYELIRLKSDVQFSVKPTDFDKYCAFATVLWINYKEDPARTVIEKKVAKTGVVIQKTDSMEKGLRYMDAHGHLAYVNDFRIIIGDGKLVLDESTEAALNANKKREFFSQRAAAMRRGAGAKHTASKFGEEDFSTLELVQVIRNRQKWHTPVLVFSYDSSPSDPALYAFKNLKSGNSLETLEYFASMKALPWAVDLSALRVDTNSGLPGFLRIINLRCNDLVPKKSGSSMDPYVIVKVGDAFEKKTKKVASSVNPTWNLGWEIPCRLTDRLSVQILDKSMFGKHGFEGLLECPIADLIPVATPFVEVTKVLEAKSVSKTSAPAPPPGSGSPPPIPTFIPGTVTLEVGFRFEGQREQVLGKVFGQPFEVSIDDSIRNAHYHLIESCITAIRARGLECEGIFRQPTNQKRVDALKLAYDKGTEMLNLSTEDPFDVAFLLRTYLKELPSPLIPLNRYAAFKACSTIDKRRERLVTLSGILDQLSPHALEAFAGIVHLLSEIAKHELINKMTARNLATVLGPALVIPRELETDPSTYLADTTAVTTVLETCIISYHKLFHHSSPDNEPTKKRPATTSTVRAFIDPYLTDSLSSPRYTPSTALGRRNTAHTRAQSDSTDATPSNRSKTTQWLRMSFELDPKLLEPEAVPEEEEDEEDEFDDAVADEDDDSEEGTPQKDFNTPQEYNGSDEEP